MKSLEYKLIFYNLVISVITLSLITLLDLREVYEMMLLYSLNSLIVFGLIFLEEIRNFKGINMNLLLLVGCFTRFVIPSLTRAWGAMNGEDYFFYLTQNDVTDYMFPTAVWMNIYYSIFYWCFKKFSLNYTIEDFIEPFFHKFKVSLISIPLFIIGIIYNIITSFIPVAFIPGIVQTLCGQLATLAILAQLFNAVINPTKYNKTIFLSFVLLSIWQTSFYGFYKGAIVMNLFYYLLYYFLDCKRNHKKLVTPAFISICILAFLFTNYIVYPFMTTKRVVSGWDASLGGGMAVNAYSNVDILMDVLRGNIKMDPDESKAASRLDAITPNAFFYKECCTRGLRTTKVAKNNIEQLVPRVIKPDKHDAQAGLMANSYILTGSFDNYDTSTSNDYIGQFASAYLMGGPILVILLAFFNGWFLSKYYNFLLRHINNIIAILLFFPFLLSGIYAFEEIHDGGALRTGYNFAMMILVYLVTKFFPGLLTIKMPRKW